ncbi:trihelix transcription factor GTL1-like isoform X1 [Hordeum vulgare subsp. vulgare]|uniref:Myb-like domain-containing protein n=1 Tax=Hordeum vulgare subsp. vulgare TaxID=112509 RepID=A0A287UDK9_HORVV|nr:trihelix transcription factor GTL1-like isoform X1 [Hordeum vulgare subsp. vulgare]XP_044954349.1 trihelix transcription factor GTL1-like isoform X1 [Hordeum vulgare subsp. vulgare]XP_044954350.1 trihelix transcription factor GTL1-like isoform X1 [Hordeum vulgare subsp. vulgare]
MQHPEQGGAGYPYGPPLTGMAPFLPQPASATVSVSSIIPSPSPTQQAQPAGTNFEQLPAAGPGGGAGAVSFHEDDDMPVDGGSGRSALDAGAGGSGSRWPREETVALIRIRSEMDAAFRNAALKAPVWEEVSRKLAELGYCRSAKKCKEKFENVDKYYRRTKEGRAGRQDGKNYRFFEELEALHAAAPQHNHPMATATTILPDPRPLAMAPAYPAAGLPDLSLSSNSESESDDGSDEGEDQAGGGGRSNESMMALFEGMIKQITEKQDATQRLFLETLEKWEADRTAREEAWRRQELARISREREQHARERAAAAARDAALIAFLQRVGGNSVLPTPMPAPHPDAPAASLQLVVAASEEGGRRESGAGMSRWPKEEVHALIQLRMEKDEHCQDMGAKGPLWEDISAGMRRIGYNRSSKRCKEKWENINKYFKKVKESNKRRPDDSKTCPYFHQLDAIYRKKQFAVANAGGGCSGTASGNTLAAVNAAASEKENHPWRELEGKVSNDFGRRYRVGGGSSDAPPGDAEMAAASTVLDAVGTSKKSEDNMQSMEPNMQSQQKELTATDETDSDDIETNYTDDGDDDDDGEDGNEDDKMKYTIEFQKHKESGSSSAPAPATVVTSSAPTSSTFLAVQ